MVPDPNEVPIEHIINFRNQGLSDNQIIQNLQREGYTINKINMALEQIKIKQGITAPFQINDNREVNMPPPMGMPPPQSQGMPSFENNEEKLQEIAEAIIDEKWQHLSENINRIIEWKEQTETRITQIEQSMKDLKDNFDRLHEGILGKIGDYDKSMTNIGTEIRALEKVFQKILPGFMENVNELSRITDKMKIVNK